MHEMRLDQYEAEKETTHVSPQKGNTRSAPRLNIRVQLAFASRTKQGHEATGTCWVSIVLSTVATTAERRPLAAAINMDTECIQVRNHSLCGSPLPERVDRFAEIGFSRLCVERWVTRAVHQRPMGSNFSDATCRFTGAPGVSKRIYILCTFGACEQNP